MNDQLFRVLVGSRAHQIYEPTSDYDYRGVFYAPTRDFLVPGAKVPASRQSAPRSSDIDWELGHFLELALKSNPTVLECFVAPPVSCTPLGHSVRALFPLVWGTEQVWQAFTGYSTGQYRKFQAHGGVLSKLACARLRVLFQGYELLRTGSMPVDLRATPIAGHLCRWRDEPVSIIEMNQVCTVWSERLGQLRFSTPAKVPDREAVTQFLLDFRRKHWDG